MAKQETQMHNLEVENKKLKKKQERIKRQKAKWNERDFLEKSNDQLLEENRILKRRVESLEAQVEFAYLIQQANFEKCLENFYRESKEEKLDG